VHSSSDENEPYGPSKDKTEKDGLAVLTNDARSQTATDATQEPSQECLKGIVVFSFCFFIHYLALIYSCQRMRP
jgi:hypothetical protein